MKFKHVNIPVKISNTKMIALIPVMRSVARIRLVKTQGPSACTPVNWKECKPVAYRAMCNMCRSISSFFALLSLFFGPEDGGDMFLRNVS